MKNMTLENITTACRGVYHGDETKKLNMVAGVVIDSRKVKQDFLFVAIDGEHVNAHTFIPDTISKGALCVITHEDLGEADYPYILVESTGQALLDIAKLYRDSFDLTVVGVTGSVGKTSTKEMMASVLSQKFCVHKTLGNFNNEWGLPITIFGLNETHQIAILEMGVNHFGEMRRLSSVASPDICVITNIGIAHLEFFKTREGILQEKTEMIQDMKAGGSIVLNGDDDLLSRTPPIKGASPLLYGTLEHCQCRATNLEPLGLKGTACTMILPDASSFHCIIPIPGAHMVSNALASASVGFSLGLTKEELQLGIEGHTSLPGRNHIIATEKLIILDDCYNANPISMKAAIDVLDMAIGRKVAILGNMGELGSNEADLHHEVGSYAASKGIDLVCGIGDLAKDLINGIKNSSTEGLWFKTKDDFLAQISQIILDQDNVLVKASHGMHFPDIVDALTQL